MNMNCWEWIESTFHDNAKSSRILVTVRTLPAASDCTSNKKKCNGYVYHMRTLGDEDSKTIACLTELANDETQTLQHKCDGLPLALVSVHNYFRRTRNRGNRCRPTIQECKTLCKNIGSFLHDNNPDPVVAMAISGEERDPFGHLRDELMNNFASLPTWTLRDSLQYLGIFPNARQLNRNKIIRRWVAEGYAPGIHAQDEQEKADGNFKLLVEKNIIQTVGISTSGICRAPGIVHEFVRDKSKSENFIRAFDASTPKQRHKRVRHFVVRGSNNICSGAAVNMKDLSHIRSLTVQSVTDNGSGSAGQGNEVDHGSGSEGDGFFKFSKYKVIRVLDLEECTQVNNSLVENICKLWNLRYLSLGDKVNKVPKEISQLNLLERLHLSKAVETELPVEIISMSSLIHLSGKLMLPASEVCTQPQLIEKSKRSELQTLSGIVASRRQGFLLLVPQMKKLRKVKIFFSQSTERIIDLSKPLLDAITGYLQRVLDYNVPRSLCLDFKNLYQTGYSDYPRIVMEGLCPSLPSARKYYLTSLKLHLQDELLSSMTEFIVLLSGLQKLCLSLTSVTKDLLSAISEKLHMLAHLKLKADKIHVDLVIQDGKFQKLENLCFIVKEFCRKEDGSIPKIHVHGILPELQYFQLLCENLADDRCGIDINKLEKLQEIELHAGVTGSKRQQWETAARNHRNRPIVLPFLSVDDPAGAPIPAAGAAEVVDRMPAAVAPASTSALVAVDETDGVVPVTATISLMPNEDGNAAPVDCDDEIVPDANGAEGGDEPTEDHTISAPTNDDSPYPANSVASATLEEDAVVCPEHSMTNRLIPNNSGSQCPIDIGKPAPDATIEPVREVPNHAPEHIASSSGGHAVHAR